MPRLGHPGIEQRLLSAWKRLETPAEPILLLAFSGGPDSLALALALARLAPLGGFRLEALHVDHRLRPTSAIEAGLAREHAASIGLDCRIVTVADDLRQRHRGVGLEEAARRERYLALARRASEIQGTFIVTAHHQEDQTETVMLHILRGAGLAGAAGMRPISTLSVPWWPDNRLEARTVTLWRPWLTESEREIAAFRQAVAPGIQPVIDPSNADETLLRNRVRHRLMPLLEELRPGATGAIARFGQIAASDDRFLDQLAREQATTLDRTSDGLSVAGLRRLPPPLLRRVLRRELLGWRMDIDVSAERVSALAEAVLSGRGNVSIQIGAGLRARIAQKRLRLEEEDDWR